MVAAAVRRRRDIAPRSSQARAQRESRSRSAGRLRSSPREQGAKKASLGPLLDIYRSFCPDRLGANISKIHSKRRRFSQGCASVGIGGDDVRAGGSLAGARAKRVAKPAQPRLESTGGMMKLFLFGSRSAAGAGQLVFPPDTALCCRCCHTAPMTTPSMALATSAPINAHPAGSK